MSTIVTIQSTDLITNSRADINSNFAALNADKIETSVLDTDTTLAANSDAKVATQKAVKAYVDAGGNVNASTTAKGIVEEATAAEVLAGTAAGATGARLFVNPSTLWIAGEVRFVAFSSVPSGWLECDGSAVSRTTYATLFAAISTTFGSGNGSTTFNLPDFRGRVPLGKGATTFTLDFAAADVTTGTDEITVPSNFSLYDGTKVRLTTTGGLPAGLALATDYYVIRVSATVIKLASSRQNAIGGAGSGSSGTVTAIDITTQGTGTHTITVQDLSTRTLGEKGGEETRALTIAETPSHVHGAPSQNGSGTGFSGADNSQTADNTGATGGNTPHNIMQPYLGLMAIIRT